MRKFVVIPCFNEEKTISGVVEKCLLYCDRVIVSDDGSTDGGVLKLHPHQRLIIISSEKNEGKGIALRKGINKAISLGAEQIVTIDADFQHPPEYIPVFFEALRTADLVIGSRKREFGVMPLHRIFSNFLTSKLISMKTGMTISDSQCGFRAFNHSISDIFNSFEPGFGFETEILITAGKRKVKTVNISIPTIYGDTASKMKNWETTKTFLKLLLR